VFLGVNGLIFFSNKSGKTIELMKILEYNTASFFINPELSWRKQKQ